MPNALLVLILILSAIAAVLAGMGVFSNNRPPDARLGQVIEELDELRGMLNSVQKSVMQIERKMDKDQRDARSELKDLLESMANRIDKRFQELS